jgi:hypothetical protein
MQESFQRNPAMAGQRIRKEREDIPIVQVGYIFFKKLKTKPTNQP